MPLAKIDRAMIASMKQACNELEVTQYYSVKIIEIDSPVNLLQTVDLSLRNVFGQVVESLHFVAEAIVQVVDVSCGVENQFS